MTALHADEEAPFDPHARFIARDGVAYKDFAAYILGQPDPEDQTNPILKHLRAQGRSEAFCREYRIGYDKKYVEATAQSCTEVGDEDRWARQQACAAAFAGATKLYGEYHEC